MITNSNLDIPRDYLVLDTPLPTSIALDDIRITYNDGNRDKPLVRTARNPDARRLVKFIGDIPLVGCSALQHYAAFGDGFVSDKWSGEPKLTTYTQWAGTVDYIFILKDRKQQRDRRRPRWQVFADKVLCFPTFGHFYPGLPNGGFGSDHLSLVVDMCVLPAEEDEPGPRPIKVTTTELL